MAEPRTRARHMSAGIILVDPQGRVLLQLRDDKPGIMYPGHWGITGGAADTGETPEQTALRETEEETGLRIERMEPFRAYYFSDAAGGAKASSRTRADYELYLFHAACSTPAEELVCGEGRELRFFGADDALALDLAYNHREVLGDFFASPAYARYVLGDGAPEGDIDPVAHFTAALAEGLPWFDALMEAIALWERPLERVGEREYRFLVGGEAFDWLLLAERLLEAVPAAASAADAEALLFEAHPPGAETRTIDDERLRALIGDAKHRAHLNFVYGVTVEEALQYAAELEVSKERTNVAIRDKRDAEGLADPVFERIYGATRAALLGAFRDELQLPHNASMSLTELREFQYWLFKYRVKNQEPARVASDTRKALALLSRMEDAAHRSRRTRAAASAPSGEPAETPA